MSFDFIDSFLAETDDGLSPERFRLWCALSTLSAASDRRVWTSIRPGMALYPNLYVLLVGPPGAGKSQGITKARRLLETQDHVSLSPSSTTHEAFINLLAQRAKVPDTEGEVPMRRATMALVLSEWGTFMRKPSNDDMALLADAYDCGDIERFTIGRQWDRAPNVFLNILAGCTPAWFAEGFPPNSYEQGLPSRFHFIYQESPENAALPDFNFTVLEDADDNPFIQKFLPHLDKISRLRGFIPWSPEAAALFNEWKMSGFAPIPDDPMLAGYCVRRPLHLAKIAVLCAMSNHVEDPVVRENDLRRAMTIMFDAEKDMPKALSAAGGNTYRLRENAISSFVDARWRETKKPVAEWEVRQKLGKLVPPQLVKTILDEMIASGSIRAIEGTKAPQRRLTPGVRR